MEKPYGTLEINGLRLLGNHGVRKQESLVGNTFEVNVKLSFDAEHAMRTDRLDLTISYAEVIEIVRQEMAFPSKLLEHVVYRIYQALMHRYSNIQGGEITVYKINPPVAAELGRTGFTFRW